jgi:hypothetical protein
LAELWLVLYFIAALFLCVMAFMLSKKGPDLSAISIGTAFLQIYSMFGNFNLHWPGEVEDTFKFASIFRFEFQFVSPECSADFNYVTKWLVVQLIPIAMLVVYLVTFGFVYSWKRIFISQTSATKSLSAAYAMFNAFLMCLDFMFITLMTKILELFDCTKVGGEHFYLKEVKSIRCYDETYYNVYFPLGVLFLGLYGIGVPLLFTVILVRNKSDMQKDQLARVWGNETEVNQRFGLGADVSYRRSLAEATNHVREKYSVIYKRYKPTHYYWGVVLLVRKFLIVATITCFTNQPVFQAVTVLWILFASYIIHNRAQPFKIFHHDVQSYELFVATAKKRFLEQKYGLRWLAFYKRRMRAARAAAGVSEKRRFGQSNSVQNLEARERRLTSQFDQTKRLAKRAFISSQTTTAGARRNGSVVHAISAVHTQLRCRGCSTVRVWLPLQLKLWWRSVNRAVAAAKDPLLFSANYNTMESMFILVTFHIVLAGVLFHSFATQHDSEDSISIRRFLLVGFCLATVYGAVMFLVSQVLLELYKALFAWEKGRRAAHHKQQLTQYRRRSVARYREAPKGRVHLTKDEQEAEAEDAEQAAAVMSAYVKLQTSSVGYMPLDSIAHVNGGTPSMPRTSFTNAGAAIPSSIAAAIAAEEALHPHMRQHGARREFSELGALEVLHGLLKRQELVSRQEHAKVKALDWLEEWVRQQQLVGEGMDAMLQGGVAKTTNRSGQVPAGLGVEVGRPVGNLRTEISRRIVIRRASHRAVLATQFAEWEEQHDSLEEQPNEEPSRISTPREQVLAQREGQGGETRQLAAQRPRHNPKTSASSVLGEFGGGHHFSQHLDHHRQHYQRQKGHKHSQEDRHALLHSASSVVDDLVSVHTVVVQWLLRFCQWGCGFAVLIFVLLRLSSVETDGGPPRTLSAEHEMKLLWTCFVSIMWVCLSNTCGVLFSIDGVHKALTKAFKISSACQTYLHSGLDTILGLLCFSLGAALLADVTALECDTTLLGACPGGKRELRLAGTLLVVLSGLLRWSSYQLCSTAVKLREHEQAHKRQAHHTPKRGARAKEDKKGGNERESNQRRLSVEVEHQGSVGIFAVGNPLLNGGQPNSLTVGTKQQTKEQDTHEGAAQVARTTATVPNRLPLAERLADVMFQEAFRQRLLWLVLAACSFALFALSVFAKAPLRPTSSALSWLVRLLATMITLLAVLCACLAIIPQHTLSKTVKWVVGHMKQVLKWLAALAIISGFLAIFPEGMCVRDSSFLDHNKGDCPHVQTTTATALALLLLVELLQTSVTIEQLSRPGGQLLRRASAIGRRASAIGRRAKAVGRRASAVRKRNPGERQKTWAATAPAGKAVSKPPRANLEREESLSASAAAQVVTV